MMHRDFSVDLGQMAAHSKLRELVGEFEQALPPRMRKARHV
jgi:hypothetical protein